MKVTIQFTAVLALSIQSAMAWPFKVDLDQTGYIQPTSNQVASENETLSGPTFDLFNNQSSYLGCFQNARPSLWAGELKLDTVTPGVTRITTCHSQAVKASALYYGLKGGNTCVYGSNPSLISSDRVSKPPKAGCNVSCGNDGLTVSPMCGGNYAASVYQVGPATQLVSNFPWAIPTSFVNRYVYRGCFSDGAARILNPKFTNVMDVAGYSILDACYNQAKANNAIYFGLQSGKLCSFGYATSNLTALQPQLDDSACPYTCDTMITRSESSASVPKCGNSWIQSIYQITDVVQPVNYAPAGSKYQGCYIDKDSRVLPNQFSVTAGDEINSCFKYAQTQRATYFGLQYGNQCFTGGNSTNIQKYGFPVPDAQCDMPCGDPSLLRVPGSKMCGGVWLNSIFKVDGFKTLSPPIVPVTTQYTYKGCYIDAEQRVLPEMTTVSGNDLIGSCYAYALTKRAQFFSLQYGSQCFIGGSKVVLETYGPKQSEDACNYNCNGNGMDYIDGSKCGGFWRNSLFEVKPYVQVGLNKEFTYKGCFIDTDVRVLPNGQGTSGSDLTFACYKAAKANNDQFFGTQYGFQCFSGKKTSVLAKYGKVDDSECNQACGPLSSTKDYGYGPKCGSSWRNSIYEIQA